MQIATALFKTEKSPRRTQASSRHASAGRNACLYPAIPLWHPSTRGQP